MNELGIGVNEAAERFPTHYGLWAGSQLRGELGVARETAEIFLRDAEREGRMLETAVANRVLGLTRHCEGNFVEARTHLEQALRIYDPNWDREPSFVSGWILLPAPPPILLTHWQLGEIQQARNLAEEAMKRAIASDHAPTLANVCHFRCMFEMLGGDAKAARYATETLVEISRPHASGRGENHAGARRDRRRQDSAKFVEFGSSFDDPGRPWHRNRGD
jgi:hypothetical protein